MFSLSNASFVHNQAGQAGGAIFCSSGAIEVEFSLLYNNTASVSGGAIQAKGDSLVTFMISKYINDRYFLFFVSFSKLETVEKVFLYAHRISPFLLRFDKWKWFSCR